MSDKRRTDQERAPTRREGWRPPALAILLAILFLTIPASLSAQQRPNGFRFEGFRPVASQHAGLLNLRRPDVLDNMVLSVGAFGHYAHKPLKASDLESDAIDATIDGRLTTEIGMSLGLFDLAQISAVVPVVPYQTGDGLRSLGSADPLPDVGIADSRLAVDLVLLKPEWAGGFGVSTSATLHLPNQNRVDFLSDGAYRIEPNIAFNYLWPRGHEIVANASVDFGSPVYSRRYHYTDAGSARIGLGGAYHLRNTAVDIIGSVFGSRSQEDTVPATGGASVDNSAHGLEALAGVRIDLGAGFRLQAGGGAGLTKGIAAPDARAFTSLHWIHDPEPRSAEPRWTHTPDSPEVDADNDGIVDTEDECPNEPEDPDGVRDDDGCPDRDRDGDGIGDRRDRCPDTPGPSENQGCPGPDSDGDGVVDSEDICPNESEDLDGYEDGDGCPDPDNDGDGFEDSADDCPDRPEDVDGDRDRDGCPDEERSSASVEGDAIEITQSIEFDTGEATLRSSSHAILDEIASLLSEHPEIVRLRIEGHTDSQGPADLNRRLSRERAGAVKDYLVDEGIDSNRLEAVGLGESEPVAPNDSAEGRSRNRRVEFVIEERR